MFDVFAFAALGVFCAATVLSLAALRWAMRGSWVHALLAIVASTLFVFVFPTRLVRGYDLGTLLVVMPLALSCWALLELVTSGLSANRELLDCDEGGVEPKPQMSLRSMVFASTAIGIMFGLMSLAESINGPRDIVGRFVSVDAPDEGVSGVIIWISSEDGPQQKSPSDGEPKDVVVAYDGKATDPEYVLLRPGDTLTIRNDSSHAICPKIDFTRSRPFNAVVPAESEFGFSPLTAERLPCVLCGSIRPDWRSFVFVTDSSVAVSNKKGEWRLPFVSRGQHKVRIWHKDIGYIRQATLENGRLRFDHTKPSKPDMLLDVGLMTRDIGSCRLNAKDGDPVSARRKP